MKNYSVYKHPTGKIEAVKNGFNWVAFFFPGIWPFFKKNWGVGLGIFVLLVLINVIGQSISEHSRLFIFENYTVIDLITDLIVFGISLFIGFKAYDIQTENLERKGYKKICDCEANNKEDAVAKAFESDEKIIVDVTA